MKGNESDRKFSWRCVEKGISLPQIQFLSKLLVCVSHTLSIQEPRKVDERCENLQDYRFYPRFSFHVFVLEPWRKKCCNRSSTVLSLFQELEFHFFILTWKRNMLLPRNGWTGKKDVHLNPLHVPLSSFNSNWERGLTIELAHCKEKSGLHFQN